MGSGFDVHLPEEFRPLLDEFGVSTSLEDRVKLSIAMALLISRKISLARAAELCGYMLDSFMDLLRDQGIPWMDYSHDDLSMDDRTIAKLMPRDKA